ncbi:MAG: arylamine N-acetyltransferase [Thermaceae bacterium]|nr:arylamine N-acetyltransferase [Thermaceae bacterium]
MDSVKLEAYLHRIGYTGPREPRLETLSAVHQAHLRAIPYENLDIHFARPILLSENRFFQKLVLERRGGWCYEMNGLLAWALRELGFRLDYLAGAVPRASAGPNADGNHLVLLVHLPEGDFIADVGFGDGFLRPIPLREGSYIQDGLEFRLERGSEAGRWIMHNHQHGAAQTYDFSRRAHTLEDFVSRCAWLQTSPQSGFVQKTVCQRFVPGGIITLREAVFKRVTKDGVSQRIIETEAEYRRVLSEDFGLELDTSELWPKVHRRHQEWVAGGLAQ